MRNLFVQFMDWWLDRMQGRDQLSQWWAARSIHEGDRVRWDTDPCCLYQGQAGTVLELEPRTGRIASVEWDGGSTSLQPCWFIRRIDR